MTGGKMNILTGYREGNKHKLKCPSCTTELTSIGTYKEMERDRVKWGWIDREDRDSHLLDLEDLGFCANCGGFVKYYDFNRTDQEELAEKVFNEKALRSAIQARSNNLRKHLRLQRREDWQWKMRDGRKLNDGTPEPEYSDGNWVTWYVQYKKEELERAKTKQWVATVLDNDSN